MDKGVIVLDIKEIKLYTKNLDSYEAEEVDELQPMTDKELDEFQYEIEYATGNTSDWDRLRAVISFRKIIHEFEIYAEQMRNLSVHWQGEYNRSQGVVFDKKKEIEKLELEISELKTTLKDTDLDYLKSIEKDYGQLINEHAELVHFKDVATKYLTEERLIQIEEEIVNVPDTYY